MKYSLNQKNYRDFKTYELGKRAARAYFIPYPSKQALSETHVKDERTGSPLVRVLSGEWDFKYFADKDDIPSKIDTDAISFDTVTVPSTWQRTGYEPPVYLNCPYPFELMPPELPEKMSAGIYRKCFTVDSLDKNYIISFLGVIPCIDLYVNGSFVGYSEGAHNTAEFELNSFLTEGENELVAVIHKWSTGTYLECQDMFRENGIFRDVLLYEMPLTYINDYAVKTVCTDSGYNLEVSCDIVGAPDGCTVSLSLEKNGEKIATASAPAQASTALTLDGLNVTEWNAEIPTLYELYITLEKDSNEIETLRNLTGFKTVQIDGTVYKFNDKNIKFKGVNHHDTHYKNGYVMNVDDLIRDIELMKSLNVNAVRTSHYPPDPIFLSLCDIYGLYVVDEADIETHGCWGEPINDINHISNSARWIPRYIDRVSRMFMRDRSHPCIAMWSLGNEAGGWKCHDACNKYLQQVCPEIPVHYEGAIRTPRHGYSVISEMYTHTDDLILIRERKRGSVYKKKPFFLCEYCHAMGVGPGALEDYWDIFYSDDIFMGGCIWEWADHAIWHGDSKPEFTYGGDHGELKHDGNFCVDGLMYPDRTLHTGAYEMKAVYRPIRAVSDGDNKFTFTNTNRFRASDYIEIRWSLLCDGSTADSGSFTLAIPPMGQKTVRLPLPEMTEGEYLINFSYFDGDNHIADEQCILRECIPEIIFPVDKAVCASQKSGFLTLSFDGGEAVFEKKSGALVSYCCCGKELLSQGIRANGFEPNLFRAILDNDVRHGQKWLDAGLDTPECKLLTFDTDTRGHSVRVLESFSVCGKGTELFTFDISYTVCGDGKIFVESKLSPVSAENEIYTNLPRFGVKLALPRIYENANYYGRGDKENLPDLKAQSPIGIYSSKIDAMHENYIKPQENGCHCEVRYLCLTDDEGFGIRFEASEKPFSFTVHHYTQQLLKNAKHREDIVDENVTELQLDGFMRGTGTASCGQDTLKKYAIDASQPLEFAFCLSPICSDCCEKKGDKIVTRAKVQHDSTCLPRAKAPEQAGVSSEAVQKFLDCLNESGVRYHSFMILRNGVVAAECYRYPFNAQTPHVMYSVSKSVTSCAIGFAVDEGYLSLDTTVAELFPEYVPKENVDDFCSITVRHLLNMTAGKAPSCMLNKSKGHWINHFTDAPWYAKPGEKFRYTNENIFMLCAIIKRVTGISVTEFLTPRLFEPLGIKAPYWETDENGVESGGWGIYLTTESFAKILLTYQNYGVFAGKQVIPREWVEQSTSVQSPIENDNISSGYGYCFWIRNKDDFHAAGIFGQIGQIDRNNGLIVAIVSGETNESPLWKALDVMYSDGALIDVASASPQNAQLQAALKSQVYDNVPYNAYRSSLESTINGKTIRFSSSPVAELAGFPPSVLPVVATYMTKDRAGNINNIKLGFRDDYCLFQWSEGDETNCIQCGFDGKFRRCKIKLAGIPFTTCAAARWLNDNTLELFIRPLESIGCRTLTFRFCSDCVTLDSYTDPSLDEIIESVRSAVSDAFHSDSGKKVAMKLFNKARPLLEPSLKGKINWSSF